MCPDIDEYGGITIDFENSAVVTRDIDTSAIWERSVYSVVIEYRIGRSYEK